MHRNPRLLPFFSTLDDGRVVERGRGPGPGALVAGSTQTHPTTRDALLLDLASAALDTRPGGAVMAGDRGERTAIDPPPGGGVAMIGLRCPQGSTAVAASVQCETLWPDGDRRDGILAWSVDRQGGSLALFRAQPLGNTETLTAVAGTLLDAALRALGLHTPPCPSPTVWFPDGVFLARLARLLDRRGGLCARRGLSWESLSMLYPLNDTGKPLSPCLTRHLRQHFRERNTWSSLRRGVETLPASAPEILPGLTPEVAGWLDDGSFARWVLSRVSHAPSALEWLCARTGEDLAHHLSLALGRVHGPTGTAP